MNHRDWGLKTIRFASGFILAMCLSNVTAEAATKLDKGDDALLSVVRQYQAALEARSVERLSRVVDDQLIVLEGTNKNVGWADFRDNHIGPEMKEWKEFKVLNAKVIRAESLGNLGYVIEEVSYQITMPPEKKIRLRCSETYLLSRTAKQDWKILHVHSSAKGENAP